MGFVRPLILRRIALLVGLLLGGGSVATSLPRSHADATQVAAQVYADKAFEHFYSLELDDSVALYQKAIELEPQNPDFWVGLAHARMFQHLRAAGKIDAQIFGASNDLLPKPAPPDPKHEQAMMKALERAREICEKRLAADPRDTAAHFALGMAYAVEANFHVNARGKPLDALAPATKAKDHHQIVRQLDPENHDANMVIGTYEYVIGSVPGAFRWILKMLGHSGSKENGIELLLDAVYHSKRVSPPALATLAYVYNREKKYDYSRQMLQHLVGFYPRNPVFMMEVAASFARSGNHGAAADAYQEVVDKFESGAPGFHWMNPARLYFQTAVVREYARDYASAAATYDKALAALETQDGHASPPPASQQQLAHLHATILLRLGHISANLGQKEKARKLLEGAAASPFKEIERAAKNRLKNLDN